MKQSSTKIKEKKSNQSTPNPQVCEFLDEIKNRISIGFTHENFCLISRLLYKIKPFINKEEVQTLEEMWRDSFTDSCNETTLSSHITMLRERFK